MLNLNGQSLLLGGFHDHWSRWDETNASLLLAALNYYHYDFVTLMCGPETDAAHRVAAGELTRRIKIYPGREEFFGWGHVLTINPVVPRLEGDDGDYEAALRQLRTTSDLVILAHPNYPGTWETIFHTGEMDRLLDEGIIDGVNLINTNGFEVASHRELINWYHRREAAGLKTPIVGGWDAHMVLPQKHLPPVLYDRACPPRGHIDTCGANRTILFCDENSLEAINAAVLDARTVIEDVASGELVGPRALTQFLGNNGYAAAIREMDARRDDAWLQVPSAWVAAKTAVLTAPPETELRIAVPTIHGLQLASTAAGADGDGLKVIWPAPPGGRDTDYSAVVVTDETGYERIWAVETRHPVQVEILPQFVGQEPGLEVSFPIPFDGKVGVSVEDFVWSGRMNHSQRLPLGTGWTHAIKRLHWSAQDNEGTAREGSTDITFLTAPLFQGDWGSVPTYAVNDARFVPGYTYGAKRPYPGPQVFAVEYQFAWDTAAFHLRARVVDRTHFQPSNSGHYLYNADCLQLAIDPLLGRSDSVGHVYSFNLALTPDGPLAHRWLTPDSLEIAGFAAPPADSALPAEYLRITPWENGLLYDFRLPWSELAPASPAPGARVGIYTIAFNNDGEGLLDTLHWPVPIDGMWQSPRKWGVLSLV